MTANVRIVTGCLDSRELDRLASGVAAEADVHAALAHAVDCAACRDALIALSLADNPGTPEEEALVARALERPARPFPLPAPAPTPIRARSRWRVPAAAAAAMLACAAAIGVVISRDESPDAMVLALATDARPVEGRLSLGLPHAPYRPTRGTDEGLRPLDDALGRLLARKQREPTETARPLAALYVARGEPGDLGRAEAELRSAVPGPERDNDLAVVLLAEGRAEDALASVRSAIAARPDFAPARFNLALALAALGRRAEAAHAFRDYLGSSDVMGSEAAWIAEARERLVQLEQGDR